MNNLNLNDILILPSKSSVLSRSECSIKTVLGNFIFDSPVIPANMPSIISKTNVKIFTDNSYFYIYHRMFGVQDVLDFALYANCYLPYTSISIGVKDEWAEFLHKCKIRNIKLDFITIDIAFCWNDSYIELFSLIKDLFPDCFLICGNGFTKNWIDWLENTGFINCAKVGVGTGSVCRTRHFTGVGSNSFSDIRVAANAAKKISIIADGGINLDKESNTPYYGDIAKSLVAGASMVMSGLLWKGCNEVPAITKGYFGNASSEIKGKTNHIEGIKIDVIPYSKSIKQVMNEIGDSLKSTISYIGGKSIKDLDNAEWRIA